MDLFLWPLPMGLFLWNYSYGPIPMMACSKDGLCLGWPIPMMAYSYDDLFLWGPIPMIMAYSYNGLFL